MSDQSPQKSASKKGLILAVLCAAVVFVIVILTLLGPAIGREFSHPIPIQECWFETDVIVFEDANNNQVQDTGEAGIEDVTVNLTVDGQIDLVERTGEDGLAYLWWYNPSCITAKTFEIIVDFPSGYRATTVTTFGPYVVTFIGGPDIPLFVGLKESD